MDGNSSLERRFSFNMAQGNPVAESTHLNISSFSWGSSISPKHRSNSSICLNNKHTPFDYNKSIVSPKSKNITKIDARIAADVQSKGLASRIVKYHESGTRLNRSMSAHNLYSKPGQFPAVTLKKTDLPYRATKQELSMIRIPPPEKSSFYGNTISSLIRSNSVVGLQSIRNEDLSRENRPIMHPPPTENDMAPTRSVLDVLKEISRKRINSDDLEADETSKKYCNRAGNDFVDTGNNTTSSIPQNFLASPISCQRYKRQRDGITPHQSVQLYETKSPEQAKKRVCNYNNDITSSLSSSIKCKLNGSSKRMSASCNINQTMPTNLESYETQKAKMQRYHDHYNNKTKAQADVRFKNLESTLRNVDNTVTPITSISPTACVQDQCNIDGVPPKRTVSEPVYSPALAITMNSIQPANKPRLTLFNKKYDNEESSRLNELSDSAGENNDDLNNFGDCAGIPFVKPKKLSSISGSRNPVIERTQKSKLALMLSGLRGELYQNSDTDELDSSKEKPNTTEEYIINSNRSAVISALKSTSTLTTLAIATSSSNLGMPSTSSALNLSTTAKVISPSLSSSNKTTSPLVGLKLSQPKPLSADVSSTLSIDSTKITSTNPKQNVPVLGCFSLGETTSGSTLVINSTTSNNNQNDFVTPKESIVTIPISSTNAISFGQPAQLTSTSSSTSDSNTNKLSANKLISTKDNALQFLPVGNAFSISTTNTTTSSNAPISLTAATTNAFSFGTNATATTISTPNPVVSVTSFNSTGKSNNAFNFTVSSKSSQNNSTSDASIMFGSLTSLATPINTTSTSVVATTPTSALTFGEVTTSKNMGGLTATSFTLNTPKQSAISEPTTISSSGTVSTASFNFGSNLNAASIPKFGTITNAVIKTQPIHSAFSFGSDTKIQNPSSGDKNNSTVAKQTVSNDFNPNPKTLFGTQSFNAPSTGDSTPMFGNVSNSSEKNVFNSSNATSIFGSSSAKGGANKPAALATPSVFGGTSTNGTTPTPFSFGSEHAITQTTNTNNASAASGGFSFSSAVSNSSEVGTFGFGSKAGAPTNTSINTFGVASTSAIQNKNFTFGSAAANKPDNYTSVFGGGANKPTENPASPGGFSFGSSMTPKTSTFSFGAGNNSFSGSNVSSTNNSTSGFAFGGAAALKPNEVPTNKAFSFGSPQPPQQQKILSEPKNSSNSSNIFGSSVASKTAPPPAFNFNSGISNNLKSNAPATNNLFASPPSTIQTGDRPIRRATRRLQK